MADAPPPPPARLRCDDPTEHEWASICAGIRTDAPPPPASAAILRIRDGITELERELRDGTDTLRERITELEADCGHIDAARMVVVQELDAAEKERDEAQERVAELEEGMAALAAIVAAWKLARAGRVEELVAALTRIVEKNPVEHAEAHAQTEDECATPEMWWCVACQAWTDEAPLEHDDDCPLEIARAALARKDAP